MTELKNGLYLNDGSKKKIDDMKRKIHNLKLLKSLQGILERTKYKIFQEKRWLEMGRKRQDQYQKQIEGVDPETDAFNNFTNLIEMENLNNYNLEKNLNEYEEKLKETQEHMKKLRKACNINTIEDLNEVLLKEEYGELFPNIFEIKSQEEGIRDFEKLRTFQAEETELRNKIVKIQQVVEKYERMKLLYKEKMKSNISEEEHHECEYYIAQANESILDYQILLNMKRDLLVKVQGIINKEQSRNEMDIF